MVGQGSSVIDFSLNKKELDMVMVSNSLLVLVELLVFLHSPIHSDFEIEVVRTQRDTFNGWYMGQLEVFDRLDDKFNGTTKTFNLSIDGEGVAIVSQKGSRVDVSKHTSRLHQ